MAAPIGGLLWAAGAFALRVSFQCVLAKRSGHRFDAFDRPPPPSPTLYTGRNGSSEEEPSERDNAFKVTSQKGRFF